MGFPSDLDVKNLPANAGDVGLILESGRSPGEVNDDLLQYSCQWSEEPGRLQLMGLQRIRHDRESNTLTFSIGYIL